MRGHSSSVNSITFNENGTLLASGASDKTIKIWNIESFIEIATLNLNSKKVNSVAFSKRGAILASSFGKEIKLLNLKYNKENLNIDFKKNNKKY